MSRSSFFQIPPASWTAITLALFLAFFNCGSQPNPIVAIDGFFDDWQAGDIVLRDPVDADGASVDIRSLSVASDRSNLYFMIRLENSVNLQMLDGTLSLLLDIDGDSLSGGHYGIFRGVDLVVDMSPPRFTDSGIDYMGMAGRRIETAPSGENLEQTVSVYDLGFLVAPTFASNTFELRLNAPDDHDIRGQIIFTDASGVAADRTGLFRYRGKKNKRGTTISGNDPLARPPEADFRLLSWNIADRSILYNKKAFQTTFRVLQPDILLLDEVTGSSSREDIEAILNGAFASSGDRFSVVFGNGGGYQRGVVAARFPLTIEPVFDFLPYPRDSIDAILGSIHDSGRRHHQQERFGAGLAATAAAIGFSDKLILCTAIDLQSRGRFDSPEERLRITEAATIRAAIQKELFTGRYDAVLLAGDLNLVGSRQPLDILCGNIDGQNPTLLPAEPYQLDGLSNFTWYNSRDIFPPGRLDYMLHSREFQIKNSFVFNSFKLSQKWLKYYGLSGRESEMTSDHLPIVTDFKWGR